MWDRYVFRHCNVEFSFEAFPQIHIRAVTFMFLLLFIHCTYYDNKLMINELYAVCVIIAMSVYCEVNLKFKTKLTFKELTSAKLNQSSSVKSKSILAGVVLSHSWLIPT